MSKIIVITGAGAGLGKNLAQRFAEDGETVILLGRTPSKVQEVASALGEQAMALACDVGDPDSVRAAFAAIAKRHPKIDVLINNAAIFKPALLAEASDEHILSALATNIAGPLFCSRAAIPLMGRGAHIINVSSESVETPFPHHVVYQTSKAGLERMSFFLQKELASSGIRVTVIRAGQMIEEGRTWDVDPVALQRFFQASMAVGINLMERPISQFKSVTGIFRAVIDLPPDVQINAVHFEARAPD